MDQVLYKIALVINIVREAAYVLAVLEPCWSEDIADTGG